jgi:hypothetical protein
MKNIILISVILLALIPVSDASSWTLEIFGNVNLDDTIDEADVSYVEGILPEIIIRPISPMQITTVWWTIRTSSR